VRLSDVRTTCAALLCLLTLADSAAAQIAHPSRVSLDSAVAIDATADNEGLAAANIVADTLASVELGSNVQFIARPSLTRLANTRANTHEWNAQIWVAALRYERPGTVSVRIDGGFIPSPIGLANLLLRPHLNPTIAQPSSLFTPLPPVVLRGPRANLLGAVYPFGVSTTVSTSWWDARAAVIDSSPLRTRRVLADDSPPNPPRFANVVIGGGVTPFVGLRVGASVAHGGWLEAGESPAVTADRQATVVTVESEFSYRYTRLLGEWVRDRLETDTGTRVASGFFVQLQQTLAPRWFVAGRVERMTAPSPAFGVPGTFADQRFTGVEETVGYRLTPDFTLRGSHRFREVFGSQTFTHTAAVSLVWWKRVM
jgi:hypothetical protein